MILFLHNRYRTSGGEERVLAELMELVKERLGEETQLLARDSASLGRREAALGLLSGGVGASEVAGAVRLAGARVVHAHNLHPSFGWRSLRAARSQGAKVVLHLHQYRLVCAVGVCFTRGEQCTRCHGRNTMPGIRLNCRGSRGEALAYGLALSLWQQRLLEQADALLVPSRFALARLGELGVTLDPQRTRVLPPPVTAPPQGARPACGVHALVVSRLSPEKGVDVAIEACSIAGRPLVVVGDGPQRASLEAMAQGIGGSSKGLVRFAGEVGAQRLADLRSEAALALVPSRTAETFGMAAAEAAAAGLPVLASRVGALPELIEEQALVDAGDPQALAASIERHWGDESAGERARQRVLERCSPERVASALAEVYGPAPAA